MCIASFVNSPLQVHNKSARAIESQTCRYLVQCHRVCEKYTYKLTSEREFKVVNFERQQDSMNKQSQNVKKVLKK